MRRELTDEEKEQLKQMADRINSHMSTVYGDQVSKIRSKLRVMHEMMATLSENARIRLQEPFTIVNESLMRHREQMILVSKEISGLRLPKIDVPSLVALRAARLTAYIESAEDEETDSVVSEIKSEVENNGKWTWQAISMLLALLNIVLTLYLAHSSSEQSERQHSEIVQLEIHRQQQEDESAQLLREFLESIAEFFPVENDPEETTD